MKKSMNLLNKSLLLKLRDYYKDDFLDSPFLRIDRKRILQAAAVILFTAVLSVFGAAASEPLQEFSDTAGPIRNFLDTAGPIRNFSGTVPEEVQDSDSIPGLLEEPAPEYDMLIVPSASDDAGSFQNYGSTAGSENAEPDLELLLSAVSGLPGGEGLYCSQPEVLFTPQAKKVRNIIVDFQESGIQIGFILLDLYSGNSFSFNPDYSFYSASTIKGPYVAALNKFSPEAVDEYTEGLMENTIVWSSNEDYDALHYLYGNDAMFAMTEYTAVSDSIIDEYNWYPYLTPKELTQLWIGTYFYFFEDMNENSQWCRDLYTDTAESFIGSALDGDYEVYTKAGWYTDWEDTSRNDAGIVRADGHDCILTIMSDDFDSYDELEELAAALNDVRWLLYSGETEITEAAENIAVYSDTHCRFYRP